MSKSGDWQHVTKTTRWPPGVIDPELGEVALCFRFKVDQATEAEKVRGRLSVFSADRRRRANGRVGLT